MSEESYLIGGCGVSGKGAARLASFLHCDYSLADEKDTPELREFAASLPFPPRQVCFGWTPGTALPSCSYAVLSPGIRAGTPFYEALEQASERIMAELDFALNYLTCPYIGITGTNGKTTVTELTTALLQASGLRTAAAGNIGESLSDIAIRSRKNELDMVVVEISSFQLETMEVPHPAAAAVLNAASDHMNRYSSFEDYVRTKFKLLRGMHSGCIINHELRGYAKMFMNPRTPRLTFSAVRPTAFYSMSGDRICRDGKDLFRFSSLRLKGRHNAENVLAALGLVEAVRSVDSLRSPALLQALQNFKPAAHRNELFLEKDFIRYVDDSKATNPHAVNAALDSLPKGSKAILILGGQDKEMDFTELLPHLKPVRLAVLTGAAAEKIQKALSGAVKIVRCDAFEDAVKTAAGAAKKGDTVLLSPACASFDCFKSYAERGDVFQKRIRELTAESSC